MKNEKEVWMPISGYEGIYIVSNTGKIKSLERKIIDKNGLVKKQNEKILVGQITRFGYRTVVLSKNSHIKSISVHRIVAYTFIKNGNEDLEINHKDGNKLNNNIENLEIVTRLENMQHAAKKGLLHGNKKRIIQISSDGDLIKLFDSVTEASTITGLPLNSISSCLTGNNRQCGGYQWKYYKHNENIIKFSPTREKRKRISRTKILQYDLFGNLINSYRSLSEAANKVYGTKQAIHQACTNRIKTAYGFKWKRIASN